MRLIHFKQLFNSLDLTNETIAEINKINSMNDIDLLFNTSDHSATLEISSGTHYKRTKRIKLNANNETIRILRTLINIWKETQQ